MDDYSMEDLVRLSGYSARGIRHYITNHVLPRPKLAGRATRYSRTTLGFLRAIRVWREENGASITRIKRELRRLSAGEIETWASELDPGAFDDFAPDTGPPGVLPATEDAPPLRGDRWWRAPVVPGLDLVLREGAGADVRRIAEEIQARYRDRGAL